MILLVVALISSEVEQMERAINVTKFTNNPPHHAVYRNCFNTIDLFDRQANKFRYSDYFML